MNTRKEQAAALDSSFPGWRFAQRRLERAARDLQDLDDFELLRCLRSVQVIPRDVVQALTGHDRRVCVEWNAALAHRARVAPLMASSPVYAARDDTPGGA